MRHRRRTNRLGCKTAHRKAMLGNMVTSLLRYGRIVTTVPRAKELRRVADRMITLAKESSLHARRQAFSVIRDRKVVIKLFDKWGQGFADRNGGYTRIVRMGPRRGDAAMMSVVELVTDSLERPKPSSKSSKKVSSESLIPQAGAVSVNKSEPAKEENEFAEKTGISEETSVSEAAGVKEEFPAEEDVRKAEDGSDDKGLGDKTSEVGVDSGEIEESKGEKGSETDKT
jgi:large subunit ribosomal protein L17